MAERAEGKEVSSSIDTFSAVTAGNVSAATATAGTLVKAETVIDCNQIYFSSLYNKSSEEEW